MIHEDGLTASVDATVMDRMAKVKGSIFELKALCEDYRLQICGGMMGALDIFNMAICPSLLANCGMWTNVNKETIKKLDVIQNLFVKVLLRLPSSTVLPSYRAETSLLGMKWRIWEEKLLLVKAIKMLEDDVLAKEVFKQQLEMDWPGLTREAREICQAIGLPDVCTVKVTKHDIQEAVFYDHYND